MYKQSTIKSDLTYCPYCQSPGYSDTVWKYNQRIQGKRTTKTQKPVTLVFLWESTFKWWRLVCIKPAVNLYKNGPLNDIWMATQRKNFTPKLTNGLTKNNHGKKQKNIKPFDIQSTSGWCKTTTKRHMTYKHSNLLGIHDLYYIE